MGLIQNILKGYLDFFRVCGARILVALKEFRKGNCSLGQLLSQHLGSEMIQVLHLQERALVSSKTFTDLNLDRCRQLSLFDEIFYNMGLTNR